MDADEVVCPQCGHGLKEQAARRAEAARRNPVPQIDLKHLAGKWDRMAPAERRRAIQSQTLGTNRGLLARLTRLLGFGRALKPPSAKRVAARALALTGFVARAVLEGPVEEHRPPRALGEDPLAWLEALGVTGELEPAERAFLRTPRGSAGRQSAQEALWRAEGLTVLAWALKRFEVPPHDEDADVRAVQGGVAGTSREAAQELLRSPSVRPTAEIDRYATHATLIAWRLRTFSLYRGALDFIDQLRRQPAFRESWLEGLRTVNGDLAIGSHALADAPPELVERCERRAVERLTAAYWLQGDDPVYSNVVPSTLLSAC
jgi:hypothetical protein